MKTKLGIAIGSAIGTALYGAIWHGISGIEWPRVAVVAVVAVVTFVLLLLVPNRWLERKKGAGS